MHFGEYELSPGLIGLSPLPSAHPGAFQRSLVRPSIRRYPDFGLAKGRSPGFASAHTDLCAFTLAFAAAAPLKGLNLAGEGNSQVHYAKGTPSHDLHAPTACRRAGSGSLSTPCAGCFSPFPHGTCSLSVSRECLALPDGPGGFRRDFSCPALLRWRLAAKGHFAHGAVTRCGRTFQTVTLCSLPRRRRSYNPRGAGTPRVWAMPRSLAATGGITVVFSSCGY